MTGHNFSLFSVHSYFIARLRRFGGGGGFLFFIEDKIIWSFIPYVPRNLTTTCYTFLLLQSSLRITCGESFYFYAINL